MHRAPISSLLGCGAAESELARGLAEGAVLAIPTESSYGLAANPRSRRGVDRILELKGREETGKPLLVLFSAIEQLEPLGIDVKSPALGRLARHWPAALTAVVAVAEPLPASCGRRSLAVRMPAREDLRRLLARIGPVTGTSLNRAGETPCNDPDEIARVFPTGIDVLVDGGITPGGPPSTLVDATAEPFRLLRSGAFPWPPADS